MKAEGKASQCKNRRNSLECRELRFNATKCGAVLWNAFRCSSRQFSSKHFNNYSFCSPRQFELYFIFHCYTSHRGANIKMAERNFHPDFSSHNPELVDFFLRHWIIRYIIYIMSEQYEIEMKLYVILKMRKVWKKFVQPSRCFCGFYSLICTFYK